MFDDQNKPASAKLGEHFACKSVMKNKTLFIACLTIGAMSSTCFAQVSKTELKKYFASMSVADRNEIIKKMDVMSKKSTDASADVLDILNKKCDFTYVRNQSGKIITPEVTCTYKPKPSDNPFSGQSAKFDCEFTSKKADGTEKKQTRKVKYDDVIGKNGGYKEIPQAIMGTLFADLMGFKTGHYCPAHVTCIGCPSDDPWADAKASAPASKKRYVFLDVVVESKTDGYLISDAINGHGIKPQGFGFNTEMLNLQDGTVQSRIEREAIALWVNFIRHTDADPHNNKIFCTEVSNLQDIKPVIIPETTVLVSCASDHRDYVDNCPVNGIISNVSVNQKFSKSSCDLNVSFGVTAQNKLWVDKGCRAEFKVTYAAQQRLTKPVCGEAVGLVNDYGDSFGLLKGDKPISLEAFKMPALVKTGNNPNLPYLTTGSAPSAVNYPISVEGKKLFTTRISSLTDQQLTDIFTLAKIDRVSVSKTGSATVQNWIDAIKEKIRQIELM